MKINKSIKLLSALLVISMLSISCGKDPVSSNGEPPKLPDLVQVQPDLSYFNDNNPKVASTNNFNQGKYTALSLSIFTGLVNVYSGFFSGLERDDAKFKDGRWVWEWSYGYGGESVSMKYTAEEKSNSTAWTMFWSYDYGQGDKVTDYKVMVGEVANDGKSGSWTFNSLDEDSNNEVPALKTNWTKESDTKVELVTSFYDTDTGGLDEAYTYTQNGNIFSIKFISQHDSRDDIFVYWDTDAGTGYYQQGDNVSTRQCWDASFNDVTCS
ncbi:MAG: hypothetical protein WC967_00260 [Balneolaceae bacterium]